ncbi:MAG: DUF3566 domain-containing protein [Candidatus Marinimicrobia bacterium]|nr:DUF3566 domain-containing protein [Candidatus Neomarinimicrobiota bacterium]RKY61523.1 MAG: hypothetical protein DRP96_02910 [Candidatus Neomarinimicrobiota bacterium]
MEYEIRSISPSSVFKISFIVILTVSCIFIFMLSLMAMSVISSMGDSFNSIPLFQGMEPVSFSPLTILFSSILNGFILALFIMFFIMLTIIFYNIYVSHFGGIMVQLKPHDELIPVDEGSDHE